MSPLRVTIVGAGLTGSITACRLKSIFKDDVAVTVVEKSRGAGGRFSTNRSSENPLLTSDLGAQYISPSPQSFEKNKSFYDALLSADVLREFNGEVVGPNRFGGDGQHFVAPAGMNSVVKYYLKAADATVQYNFTVDKISKSNQLVTVSSKESHNDISSDAVIITVPVPQLLNLQGTFKDCLKPHEQLLSQVQYSSRYALALYITNKLGIDVPWSCKYVDNDECIRFVSVDTAKRGCGNENGSSVVVHTSVPFGLKYLEKDFSTVEPLILASLKRILPDLPEADSKKCQRWRYSQVYKPYPGNLASLLLSESPLIISGGDSFTQSTFDGCIESTDSIVEQFSKFVSSRL